MFGRATGIRVERLTPDDGCSPTRVAFNVGEKWKVEVSLPGTFFSDGSVVNPPSVSVFFSSEGHMGEFALQDPPDGSPASVTVGIGTSPAGTHHVSAYFAYVRQESHHFNGAKWNPKFSIPAEIKYYPAGNVESRTHYLRGKMGSNDPDIPCFESFWEDGSPQVIEYGTEAHGRFRPPDSGPAYVEHFPNGTVALEIFTRLDSRQNSRTSRWVCRSVDGKERPHTYGDLELIQSKQVGLFLPETGEIGREYDPTIDFFSRHGRPEDWESLASTRPLFQLSRGNSTKTPKTSPTKVHRASRQKSR